MNRQQNFFDEIFEGLSNTIAILGVLAVLWVIGFGLLVWLLPA